MPLNIKSSSLIRKNTTHPKKADASSTDAVANSPSPPAERDGTPQKTPSSLASAFRSRQPLSRGSTDSTTTTLVRKSSQASMASTFSKADKKRPSWKGVAKSLQLLKSPRGASSTSLVGPDAEPAEPAAEAEPIDIPQPSTSPSSKSKIPVRRTTLSPKASTLADVRATSPPPNAGHAGDAMSIPQRRDSDERFRTSAEFSDGSGTMVEDTQATVRALTDELSVAQQQLIETKNECSALHEHIRTLENSHNAQLRQSVEEAIKHTNDEFLRVHSVELDKQKEAVRSLQTRNEELASRIMQAEDEKTDSSHAHTSEMQSMQYRLKNLQQSLESLQHELKMKDEHMGVMSRQNGDLKDRVERLEGDGRILAEGGARVQKELLDDVNHYRHLLEEAQKNLAGKDAELTQLRTSRTETENLLICAQSTVDEKDMVIGDFQRLNAEMEERNKEFEARVVELEGLVRETQNSGRRDLQTTVDEYQRRLANAEKVSETLRSELSASNITIQQLRVSLDAARADTQTALSVSEEYTSQLRQVRQQCVVLEEEKKALQTEKADLVRAHSAQIEAERRTVHNLRRSIESSQRDASSKQERAVLPALANEELRREVTNLTEERRRKEEEVDGMKKELEVVKGEKEKVVDEMNQLRRLLEDAQTELTRRSQTQGAGEEKLKDDMQKALMTIEEQKTVIGRLQQSVGELSKEERPPGVLANVMKAGPSRPKAERSRSSSTASQTLPSNKAAGGSTRSRLGAPSISPPRKASVSKVSPTEPLSESFEMVKDQERAFQAGSTTDSDSERSCSGAARRQLEDVRKLRQQGEAGLMYKMGHAMFGSLWRRVWG